MSDFRTVEFYKTYVAFLKKRLASEEYQTTVSPEGYEKTQQEYQDAQAKLFHLSWMDSLREVDL